MEKREQNLERINEAEKTAADDAEARLTVLAQRYLALCEENSILKIHGETQRRNLIAERDRADKAEALLDKLIDLFQEIKFLPEAIKRDCIE